VREAGVEPRTALYVGDSMVDVETGRRAGVRMCVATYGFAQFRGGLALEGTELVADRPEDLPGVIEAFLSASDAIP
jgi:phosphoglycolate phosphatase-like HAD superfamily hydrolase